MGPITSQIVCMTSSGQLPAHKTSAASPRPPSAASPRQPQAWRCSRHQGGLFVYRVPVTSTPQPRHPQQPHAPCPQPPAATLARLESARAAGAACAEAASPWA